MKHYKYDGLSIKLVFNITHLQWLLLVNIECATFTKRWVVIGLDTIELLKKTKYKSGEKIVKN